MTGDVENLNLDKIFRFRKFPVYRDGRKFVLGLKNFLKKRFPTDSKNIVQKSRVNNQESMVNGQRLKVNKGFTLIELLIAIGITLVLAAAASPIYSNLQVSTQLNEASAQITQDLRLAREQSRAGVNEKAHGIKFETNQYTIFQGPSYLSRTYAYDRVNTFSDALSIATTFVNNEIVFSAGTGAPSAAGSVTITHTASGSRTVTVNSSGAIIE